MINRLFPLVVVAAVALSGCGAVCKMNLSEARVKTHQALANVQANYDFWSGLLEKEKDPRASSYIVLADQALGKLGPLMEVLQAGACPPETLVADALETAVRAKQAEPKP